MTCRVLCPWCGTLIAFGRETETFCGNCGHNAALPREECDCDQCRLGRRWPVPVYLLAPSPAWDGPIDTEAIVASGECLSCGECCPWICPNCHEQRCNWFEPCCPRCGAKPRREDYDTTRAQRELEELRRKLEGYLAGDV